MSNYFINNSKNETLTQIIEQLLKPNKPSFLDERINGRIYGRYVKGKCICLDSKKQELTIEQVMELNAYVECIGFCTSKIRQLKTA